MHATVWFDGACSGNPGPMGAGAVVQIEGGSPQVLSLAMGRGTNNQAEYHGVILGLRHALAGGADAVTVRGDSQLVLRQLEGKYAVRHEGLRALHDQARKLLQQFQAVKLEWIARESNGPADEAARRAIGG